MPPFRRLVVLASGGGSNLQALLHASRDPAYGARVVAAGSDRADAGALSLAAAEGVATFAVPLDGSPDRAAWDRDLAAALLAHAPDLVVSAGFMRLLGPAVLAGVPVVNTHPALLPSFPGAHAVRDALAHGVRLTGATVHLVDAGVDTGPIVAQVSVPVEDGDSEETLHERIKVEERRMLVDVVGRMAREGFTVTGRKVTIP